MPDESADVWQPYLMMLDRLRDRGVKVHSQLAARLQCSCLPDCCSQS
jgi:hypothetical protein